MNSFARKSIRKKINEYLKDNQFAYWTLLYSSASFIIFNIFKDILDFIFLGVVLDSFKIIMKFLFPLYYFIIGVLFIMIFKKFLKGISISAIAFMQALSLQILVMELDIVYTSWVVILSGIIGAVIYLNNFNFFNNDIKKLEKISNPSRRSEFGKYLYNEIKFIFDRLIQVVFVMITILGVEETILCTLYSSPKFSYEKVESISLYLVVGFLLSFIPMGSWLMLPAFLKLKRLKYIISNTNE